MSWYYLVVHHSHGVTADLAAFRTLLTSISPLFRNALDALDLAPELRTLLEAMTEFFDNTARIVVGDGDADFSALKRAFAAPGLPDGPGELVTLMAPLLAMVGAATGSLSALEAGMAYIAGVRDDEAEDPSKRAEAAALHQVHEVFRAVNAGTDQREVHALARSAWDLLCALPPEHALEPVLDMIETIIRVGTPAFGTVPLPAGGPARAEGWFGSLLAPISIGGEVTAALRNGDVGALRDICARLATMEVSADGEESIPLHVMRAVAYDNLSRLVPGDPEALERAIDAYRRCLAGIGRDGTLLLTGQATSLAAALRRRGRPGDFAESRQLARQVVENAAWRVLIQSDSEHATEIARTAMDTADQLTAWCVNDDAVEELVQIVDARRSLVLRSANTTRSVSAQLSTLGQDELALEWESAGGVEEPLVPEHGGPGSGWGALRRKVLRVLAKDSEDLLSPPTVEALQDALRAQGSDVLAYLLPANAHHAAVAVLVPAVGDPQVRPLPALGDAAAVKHYQEAYAAWDTAAHPAGPEYRRWCTELREVCGWAWDAAAGALLGYATEVAGREPQLVLVPLGVLGLVPWHAAHRPINGRDRHFVEDATVSYVPSGRLLCEAVARPEVPGDEALLVGNPAGDLPAGAVEAVVIRNSGYPDGVFLGGTGQAPRRWIPAPAGPGTPGQVRDHLRNPLGGAAPRLPRLRGRAQPAGVPDRARRRRSVGAGSPGAEPGAAPRARAGRPGRLHDAGDRSGLRRSAVAVGDFPGHRCPDRRRLLVAGARRLGHGRADVAVPRQRAPPRPRPRRGVAPGADRFARGVAVARRAAGHAGGAEAARLRYDRHRELGGVHPARSVNSTFSNSAAASRVKAGTM